MTRSQPPRAAVALLRRFLQHNEPLAGDLLEGFAARQSSLWFWRQVILAIVIGSMQSRDAKRPAGIAGQPVLAIGRERNVVGVMLLALGVLVPLSRPELWWVVLPGIAGGLAFGLTLVIVRRRAAPPTPAAAIRLRT